MLKRLNFMFWVICLANKYISIPLKNKKRKLTITNESPISMFNIFDKTSIIQVVAFLLRNTGCTLCNLTVSAKAKLDRPELPPLIIVVIPEKR